MTPLAIFTRPPIPGATKTRLARSIGERQAAALHVAFLKDLITRTRDAFDVTLHVAGDPSHETLAFADVPRTAQVGDDLGARMDHALTSMIGKAGHGLIIGSDSPTLPVSLLWLAKTRAREAQVLGPSADGGYFLIGGSARFDLSGMTWGTSTALAQTRAKNANAVLLPPWYDVDDVSDLRLLKLHLALDPQAAPETALALSA